MNRKLSRSILSLTLAVSALGAIVPAALADGEPRAFVAGEVLALEDTPHIFVRDEAGVLHLAADPRALAGHRVDWLGRKNVSVEALRQLNPGEPWVSMALVKIGNFIYLPQMQSDGSAPVLRMIDSIADLELIGIDAENYGRIILDQETWEGRYGLRTDSLRFSDFTLDGRPRPQVEEPSRTETEFGVA